MTAPVSNPAPAAVSRALTPTALIDESTRRAVVSLASGAVKWLVFSLLIGLLAGLKLHAPNLLAGIPALTYGRLAQAANASLIYGFASQAAFAVAIWLICRLCATQLVGKGAVVIASVFWNLGLVVGVVGILAGDASGFERFEFPSYAMAALFASYAVIGVCALLTFTNRGARELYPSIWFIFAGLIFFPWIFSTAATILWSQRVRGSVIPLVAGWAGHNIVALWLALIAIAAIYYFLPKLSGRKLANYGLAVFGFWMTVILSQAGGLHASAAFPRWVGALSAVTTGLMLLPVVANAMNWRHSTHRKGVHQIDAVAYGFIKAGAILYVATAVVAAIGAHPAGNRILAFTIFQTGLSQMALLGFIGLSLLGALNYILPRAAEIEWPSPGRNAWHFRLSLWGAILIFAPLLLGGFLQGLKLADSATAFVPTSRITLPFVGITFIGALMMIAGQICFLLNFHTLFWQAWFPREVRR